jgi:hypothetical protein
MCVICGIRSELGLHRLPYKAPRILPVGRST